MIDYTGNGGMKIEINPTIFLIIFGILVAILIYNTIMVFVRFQKNIDNYSDDNSCSKPLKLKSTKATVLSKREDGHYEGSHKQPRYINDYFITFKTSKNKNIELKVTKSFFDKIDISTSGMLVTHNDDFFDFSANDSKK